MKDKKVVVNGKDQIVVEVGDNKFFIDDLKAYMEKKKRSKKMFMEEISTFTQGKQIVISNCK